MLLSTGTRVGPYEILAAIGAGGMGDVYRARDTKLGRDVALKILPEAFANDPDRLARFRREAQVLASLNHPNIAAIYGFEESASVQALVLEFVDGPTLANLIRKGPIAVDESVRIAGQIAAAIEAAHEQGIVHRDLKPANITITSTGVVKVLDFGLAKLEEGPAANAALSQSPTSTSPGMMTGIGTILGTTAYMSPEQARGLPIDQRSDVWAFGCVLFEMLSGEPAFRGDTVSDTIARILEREPEWRRLPASTPRRIRDLLRRCLRKDLQHRLRSIAVARLEIDEAHTALSGRRTSVRRIVILAGSVTLALAIVAGGRWYSAKPRSTFSQPTPPRPHTPIAVVIADFENRTGDASLDRTLESMLKRALEGAGFISAFDRRAISGTLGVRPPEKLDADAAREIAVKQGLGVVLSGALDRQGNGYSISVKAAQAVTGNVLTEAKAKASSKEQIVATATKLVTTVRKALGDDASESDQILAMTNLSATSLDVVRFYAAAQEAASKGKFEAARDNALKAVALDPNFGVGYQMAAVASRNLHNQQDADKYSAEALRHLDGMTERERLSTRGLSFRVSGDYQGCVKEYGELIAKYPADVVGHNQHALCLTQLRNLQGAISEMRQVVALLPNRAIFRNNLALYANYASDFDTAEKEARTIPQPDAYALLSLAFAQLGQGHLPQANETYQKLSTIGTLGASFAASGLGDVAVYEGRYSDAIRILGAGTAADVASKSPDQAAAKFAALANAHLLMGQRDRAVAAAEKAIQGSTTGRTRFLAARVFVEAGALARARSEAARLSLGDFTTKEAGGSRSEPEAYAKIIEGQIAIKTGDTRQAIKVLREANALLDTWLGHFDLGRAYFEVPAMAEADAEFDLCIKRRGEALALFLDEEPTYRFLPPVFDYRNHRPPPGR